jgi:DNA-binding CsgD family transcriptional regulator
LGARNPFAFVRHGIASWRGLRRPERGVLEGALALARRGNGQTVFVATRSLHSFADRRLDMIEAKAIAPLRPYGLIRDLLNAALSRSDARAASATFPADLLAYLKNPASMTAEPDGVAWADAVVDFFAALPVRAPLTILVQHAHHADPESVRVLEALARRAATSRMLLLVTYRIDAPINTALETTVRALLDARLARAMALAAPQTDDARLLFLSAFGRSVRSEAAAASMAEGGTELLTYGMLGVEACRRAGRWTEAKVLAERVARAGESHQADYVTCSAAIALGHILADQGKWDDSRERLEPIQATVEATKEDDLIAWLYWGLARVYWGLSERRRAFEMLRLAHTVSLRTSDASLAAAIAVCGAEWLADNRRVSASQDWLDSLEQIAGRTDSPPAQAALALGSGVVALAEHDAITAAGFFRAALRRYTELGDDYASARARTRLAAALLEQDAAESRREGREELSEAHAAFTQLSAAYDVSAVEALGAKHGVRPRARRVSSGNSTSPGGITPREREVLELLVRGLTNRQIAATLSITEKTAEGHVSNILAKLGVASRGQAAGYAIANGLLEPAEA